MNITPENFVKMKVMGMGKNVLADAEHDIYWKLRDAVLKYIEQYPEKYILYPTTINTSIEFGLQENGIVISHKYRPSRCGLNFYDDDDPNEEYAIYKLTYKEVFGWELPQKIPSKQAYDMMVEVINDARPKPPALNYDI